MKKILALFLAFVIVFNLTMIVEAADMDRSLSGDLGLEDAESIFGNAASMGCFVPVLEKELEESAYIMGDGSGFLYDMDGDGVDELVLINMYREFGEYGMTAYAYSVFDVRNGKATAVVNRELLIYDAGAPDGFVSLVNYQGSKALLVFTDNGETGANPRRGSQYTLYNPKTFAKIASASIEYIGGSSIRAEACTLNGKTCTYNEFLNFQNAISPIVRAERYNNGSDGSMGLNDLLQHVKDVSNKTPSQGTVPVYRLYNPYTQEHLLTGSAAEKNGLVSAGWHLDGVAWNAPEEGVPVYRLYNPYDDWHTYTISASERDTMVAAGWKLDGVVSCGYDGRGGKTIYRLFNPYVKINFHLFTANVEERDMLVKAGWRLEGVAWMALN